MLSTSRSEITDRRVGHLRQLCEALAATLLAHSPVDQFDISVDKAFVGKSDEGLSDSSGELLVHGEGLTIPINLEARCSHYTHTSSCSHSSNRLSVSSISARAHRCSREPQLFTDVATLLILPFPDEIQESVAPNIVPGFLLFNLQLLLDYHLQHAPFSGSEALVLKHWYDKRPL